MKWMKVDVSKRGIYGNEIWGEKIDNDWNRHHISGPPPHEASGRVWRQKVAKLIFLSVPTSTRITAPTTFPLWNRPAGRSWSELISLSIPSIRQREAIASLLYGQPRPLCAGNSNHSRVRKCAAMESTALLGGKIFLEPHMAAGNG